MYISGTHSLADVATDLTIPLHLLTSTDRYLSAEYLLEIHPEVTTVVGHSLGAAIAQELSRRPSILEGRAYGSPTIYGAPKMEYYRSSGDPVSMFNLAGDRSSAFHSRVYFGNPHSYSGRW
jgi:pimeloyl-ACP methyl ester carboxylesterase